VEFRILGPLQVLDDGRPVPLGGGKQRATLAILLLSRNEVVSRDQLIDGIWGASPPPTAGPTVKTYISRLRGILPEDGRGARLTTQPPGYRLRVEPGELDLERFETLLGHARSALASGEARTGREALREALCLFRGTPLEDLTHAPFAQAEIGRLGEARLSALEQRLDADLATRRHAEVVGELESLVARHPFREVLWGQLMLALYRSGRQGEALITFDRARRTLAEELGVDPGPALQRMQQSILQQDPSLEPATALPASAAPATPARGLPPSAGTHRRATFRARIGLPSSAYGTDSAAPGGGPPRRRRFLRRRRAVAVGLAAVLVGALVAALAPRVVRRGEVSTTYRPGTVLLDLAAGKQIGFIPRDQLPVSAYPVFAGGHFWVNNWSPQSYVEIDSRTGAIMKQITPPARDPKVHRDSDTITPFAAQGNTLWVTSADDLVKMDMTLGREVGRFKLDDLGKGSGLAEGVAVGERSVWVSRDVGRGQILRLDPATGNVEHSFDNITPYLNLVYGDGSLWAGDERGISRIDSETSAVTRVGSIRGNCGGGGGGCVAAGGGFGWTSDAFKGLVYKVDRAGRLAEPIRTGIGAGFMSYADGVLWVGNRDEGMVTGIDTVTGRRTATYRFGHPVGPISAGNGVLLVSLDQGPTLEDHISSLAGMVATFFAHANELGGDEPALNADPGAYQIEFATCAKLLNYPDEPPPRGWQLRPEVAAGMPTVSADGRRYTFTIRPGYRFSPPSNEPVTAETFRYSIERALSPNLAQNPTGQTPPGPRFIDDIEGEQAFRDGTARSISGLRANGDTLSITLTKPSPDFPERLALPFFCPVPRGTPFVAGAPRHVTTTDHGSIVSAGPYYVADSFEGYVILKRNPNYHGPRPHALDAIAIREDADATAALDAVERQRADGITSMPDPAMEPGGAVDRRWGARSAATRHGGPRYFLTPEARTRFIAFNTGRGIFSDPRIRRAAAMAIDRTALAAAWGAAPTDQLLSPALPGYQNRDLYPLRPSTAKARVLMRGRAFHAVMPIASGCDRCAVAANLIRADLAAIGIDVEIREVDDPSEAMKTGTMFDLLDTETWIPYPDSASFLRQMLRELPAAWVPAGVSAKIQHVAGRSGSARQNEASALADGLAEDDVPVAAYGTQQTSQIAGPHMGCRVLTTFGYGLDLAALCITS
jgi:DNA-binding SARP family transcriptional activator/ABC-type oligopeptide transport system substrate-binding subunit